MKKNWLDFGPFTVFDVETTGAGAVKGRIVELAALRINQDGSETRFHTLVNPGCRISPFSERVHHISDAMVCDAPCFAGIGEDFCSFAAGSILVGHNARYDLSFLQEELQRNCLPLWDGKTIDTIRLLKRTHPGLPCYKLQFLRSYFGLKDEEDSVAHRAFSDVRWTAQLLEMSLTSLLTAGN